MSRTIELTQDKVAIVDDDIVVELGKYSWYLDSYGYAMRHSPRGDGKQHSIAMHRNILGLAYGDGKQVDHINHDKLDNRRENLRICSYAQNQMNQRPQNGTSSYKGVNFHKQRGKWQARITIDGKQKYLGSFKIEELAALAYDMAAVYNFGEYACTNF